MPASLPGLLVQLEHPWFQTVADRVNYSIPLYQWVATPRGGSGIPFAFWSQA